MLAAGLFVLATVIIAGLLVVQLRTRALDDAQQATTGVAQVLGEQTSRAIQTIDLTLRDIRAQVESIAAKTGAPLPDVLRSRAVFDLLTDRLKGLPQAAGLAIIGADGHIVNGSRRFPETPTDMSDHAYMDHFRNDDDYALFIGAPFRSSATGVWSVDLARRIDGPQGEFAGVAVAAVELPYMEDFYKAAMPADGSISLLRTDGTVLVHIPHSAAPIGMRMPAEAPWYRMVGAGGGYYRSPGYIDGTEYLVSVHPLRDFPVVVDVGMTQQAALAGWRRQVVWLAAGAALAAASGICLMRRIDTHLRRLTESEASLARKNRELEASRLQFDIALHCCPVKN